jgi:glycosyltransferase involved in cell wall biosynthesis
VPTVFFAFRDAPERRAALRAPGALDRYRLFGLDDVQARGATVRHNLERGRVPLWARALSRALNRVVRLAGGYGGDFASVLVSLRTANEADVVLATTDTVGIPLVMLKRAGLLRPPLVYVSIGLPERLVQLRGRRMRRFYTRAFRGVAALVAYSEGEAEWLRRELGNAAPPVRFVPFGVDVAEFSPAHMKAEDVDVVSVGTDPHRDFALLCHVASRRPELRFRIVAARELVRTLGEVPANVALETDLPLERVRDRLAAGRVVALPVRRNSYSGATTVLLQAMALGKPVVVSRTEAIARGYGLEDGVNCRLVPPEDADALERALLETLADSHSLGLRARETVERHLTWERYTDGLWEILAGAWAHEPS